MGGIKMGGTKPKSSSLSPTFTPGIMQSDKYVRLATVKSTGDVRFGAAGPWTPSEALRSWTDLENWKLRVGDLSISRPCSVILGGLSRHELLLFPISSTYTTINSHLWNI